MTALTVPPTTATSREHLADRRLLLEEQWRQQLADIVELSRDALTPAGNDDFDEFHASELLVTNQLLAAARQQLAETEAALARLDDATDGLCADCSSRRLRERFR